MRPDKADSPTSAHPPTQRYFTVEQAEETLVLVRQITRDLVHDYQELMRLRADREEVALTLDEHERLDDLNLEIDAKARRLQSLLDELEDVGCQAKDLVSGLIDFPALYQGRQVWLCWRLDETRLEYWHEWDGGFAGRKPIDAAFRHALRQGTAIETAAPDVG